MNGKHTHEERQKFQLDRIALFSDAVFAIAITLLVIEIKVPNVAYDEHFAENFAHALGHMVPEFIGFIISFMVIGQYWKAHHTIFGYVTDYNRRLLAINTWFLFSIVCMPFTTGIMSRYMYMPAYLMYSGNVIVSGLLQWWLWKYIVNKKHHISDNIPQPVVRYKSITPLIVVWCFLFSLLVNFFFGDIWARIALFSIFIVSAMYRRQFNKKYKLGDKL
jgi:uncharacterized membrane protein